MRRILVVLAVLGGVSSCGGAPDGIAVPERVVLVTIDTLRLDALGTGTPALSRFLADARRFTGARAPTPLTLPSHATMLSGLEPHAHGLHDNAAPPLPAGRGFPLLAEEFRAAGYATAAFLSCAVLRAETGLAAGFDVYECPSFGARWSPDPGDVVAEARLEAVKSWVNAQPEGGRWFLWVHFFDPHAPYREWAGDGTRAGTTTSSHVRELYDGEVRRVDAAFEQLMGVVGGDALVVLASDHGEALGEHGEATHGNLCYGATMDALLAVRGGGLAAGVDTDARSLAEIAPSLRAWCFGDGDAPLAAPSGGVVVGETLLPYRTHGWGQVFCAFDGRYSLVETGPRLELFDRAEDPHERRPLDPLGHAAYERLDRAIAAVRSGAAGSGEAEAIPDSASPYGSARLPFSRYLPRAENARRKDPARGFGFAARLFHARALLRRGLDLGRDPPLAEASLILRQLCKEDATSPAAFHVLAHAEAARGELGGGPERFRAAAAAAQEAIERGYLVAPLLHALLSAAARSEDADVRAAALRTALTKRIVPDLACCRLVVELATPADSEAVRAYLDRARPSLPPADRARLDDLR